MTDPAKELGDFIRTILVFCKEHERSLGAEAAKRGASYESLVAVALASAILERWAVPPAGESTQPVAPALRQAIAARRVFSADGRRSTQIDYRREVLTTNLTNLTNGIGA